MSQTLQKLTQVFLIVLSLVVAVSVAPPRAAAQTKAWEGDCIESFTDEAGKAYDVATIQGLQCAVANVLSIAITGIGLVGFVMMIIGSFRYLLSGGNQKSTDSARQTLTFAVVGLVVALSAFIILNIIVAFTGIDSILNFDVPDFGTTGQNTRPAGGGGAPQDRTR